jgi:hypothetical protein
MYSYMRMPTEPCSHVLVHMLLELRLHVLMHSELCSHVLVHMPSEPCSHHPHVKGEPMLEV